jgi:hypothetical protein
MARIRKLLFVLLAALVVVPAAGADAVGYGQHWPRPTTAPAVVTLIDNLPPAWHPFVVQAAVDYSAAANLNVVVGKPRQCQTTATLTSPTAFPSRSTWLSGLLGTNVTCLDLHELDAYGGYAGYAFWEYKPYNPQNQIEIDGVEIFLDPDVSSWAPEWKQWLVCHEVGHAMSLGHRPWGDNSCMVDGSGVQHPGADDIALIDSYTVVHVNATPCKRKCR